MSCSCLENVVFKVMADDLLFSFPSSRFGAGMPDWLRFRMAIAASGAAQPIAGAA